MVKKPNIKDYPSKVIDLIIDEMHENPSGVPISIEAVLASQKGKEDIRNYIFRREEANVVNIIRWANTSQGDMFWYAIYNGSYNEAFQIYNGNRR